MLTSQGHGSALRLSHLGSRVHTADRRDTCACYSGDSRVPQCRAGWRWQPWPPAHQGLDCHRPRSPTPNPQPTTPPPPAQSEGRGERGSCALALAPAGERSRRTALAISHQMSPSAAKAAPGVQTMASQAQGWAGPVPGPKAAPLLTPTAWSPTLLTSLLGLRQLLLPSPWLFALPPPFPPRPRPLSAQSLILQEAGQMSPLPGSLPLSSSHSPRPSTGCLPWAITVLPDRLCEGTRHYPFFPVSDTVPGMGDWVPGVALVPSSVQGNHVKC